MFYYRLLWRFAYNGRHLGPLHDRSFFSDDHETPSTRNTELLFTLNISTCPIPSMRYFDYSGREECEDEGVVRVNRVHLLLIHEFKKEVSV